MANNTNSVEVSATAKYVRMAPRKTRMVIDMIRNLPVAKALEVLQFSTRAAAEPVSKVLRSAIANAVNNNGLRVTTSMSSSPTSTRAPRSSASVLAPRAPLPASTSA